MPDPTDIDLLRQYADRDSETAFATLVSRHVNLVYSAALRKTGDAHAAEEITQAVFIILAQKAARISDQTILPGWLYQTARLTAASYLKSRIRRVRREQEAYMQTELHAAASDETWEQLAPLLEDAMGQLGEKDRAAVVLRFFGGKSFAEVGSTSGISENAAKKRVNRALEKLHHYFSRRGVSCTTALIAGTLLAHSVHAAPVALAKSVTAVAVAKGAAASGSTLILVKEALKLMTLAKTKMTALAVASMVLAAGVTAIAVDESFWQMKLENLDKAPPVLIIRPARYSDHTTMTSTDDSNVMTKIISHDLDFAGLLWVAYTFTPPRIILPANTPTNRFDLMLTVRSHPKEALQEAIKQELGFTARIKTLETNVLLLKIKDPSLLALHASKLGSKMKFSDGTNMLAWSGFPMTNVTGLLEYTFKQPIVVQPGLSGKYDFIFQWDHAQGSAQKKQAISNELAQAGLELVPDREPIEMLVVEKAK